MNEGIYISIGVKQQSLTDLLIISSPADTYYFWSLLEIRMFVVVVILLRCRSTLCAQWDDKSNRYSTYIILFIKLLFQQGRLHKSVIFHHQFSLVFPRLHEAAKYELR